MVDGETPVLASPILVLMDARELLKNCTDFIIAAYPTSD
jgi:hypothetical protein